MTLFAPHDSLVSLIVPCTDAGAFLATLRAIERAAGAGGEGGGLAGVPYEIIAVYGDDADALLAADALPDRPRTLRLVLQDAPSILMTGARAAAGDVIVLVEPVDISLLAHVGTLAQKVRAEPCALAIASEPRGWGRLAMCDFLLAAVGGMGAWNPITGFRAYSAAFLDDGDLATVSTSTLALNLELAVKAQLQQSAILDVKVPRAAARVPEPGTLGTEEFMPALRAALWAPLIVYGLWMLMMGAALVATGLIIHPTDIGRWANVALPAAAVFAFTLAVRRVRGRVRMADAFFPLVLLNPLLLSAHSEPFDKTLLAAGLLGLMAGAIIAMKRDKLRRYLAVAVLALALTTLSDIFAMMLPALVIWLLYVGYQMARSPRAAERVGGYIVMAAAECNLMIFCLECIFAEPTTMPTAETLFPTIVSLAEFPLLVLAIVMLALGWSTGGRSGIAANNPEVRGIPRTGMPPYFAGMLALLVGLLTMLLNNFEARRLPPPGADQTVLILCLLYTVSALHGPRRWQWLIPPLLLVAAATYTFAR